MSIGWVKLHRKLKNWGWYKDPYMLSLFIHLLLDANHEQNVWNGITVNPGELVTGLNSLSVSTGISIQRLRTCIKRLKSTNEITIKTTSKFSIISITKWADYQSDQQAHQQAINKQSTSNQQHLKNERIKEVKNSSSTPEELHGLFLDYDVSLLTEWRNENTPSVDLNPLKAQLLIYNEDKGYKYTNLVSALKKWALKEHEKNVKNGYRPPVKWAAPDDPFGLKVVK